jgi:hypothetical protein
MTWQPIDTAPTDGTELLLCEYRNNQYGEIDFGSWGWIEDSDWDRTPIFGWLSNMGRIENPTHWMLPPTPPA